MTKKSDSGLTRRDFLKTVGLGSVAATGLAATAGFAAQGDPAPAAPATGVMPRRTLGRSGVQVSALALGGMFDTINNQLLLKQALGWGVNYWDTAEAYGNGLSEEGYGRFLGRNPEARKDIFLVTKLVPKGGDFTERLDASLKRLKTDHVDLFFVHGIDAFGQAETYKAWAADMKKAGKMKLFGFSTHSNMEDCLLAAAKAGWIDAVMITYNFRLMHEAKMREAMAAAKKAGIGVVAMKTQGGGPVKTDSEAELKMAGRFLEKGFTDKQARLKALWDNPDIVSVCSQMPNLTILSANVAAARDQTALAAEDYKALHEYALDTSGDYCAGCGSICTEAVAGRVPVNDVMRCLMYYRDYGDHELARTTFQGLPAEARAQLHALDYARAEQACPRGLAIAALMRDAATLLA
jgi:predicted aldo/keto reductase-like oxidoreductase